jgi:hypothetical protein
LDDGKGVSKIIPYSPYFGIDFFKINWITDEKKVENENVSAWAMKLQIMAGVRANSPTFFKCISVYSAFRLGYGMEVADGYDGTLLNAYTNFEGLCLETELGLNLTRTVFVGFAYNYHQYFGYLSGFADHTFAFRLGFNFGK